VSASGFCEQEESFADHSAKSENSRPVLMSESIQMKTSLHIFLLLMAACLLPVSGQEKKAGVPKPLKALFLTGGGYHDYEKLAPHLTKNIGELANVKFDTKFGMDVLKDEHFADGYDVVVYDVCFDEADSAQLENAMRATRNGKPAVMIHCAVHAFRKSEKVRDWENYCGMRSKVHDPYQPFATEKLDKEHPITKNFPDDWKTAGDELYQTIEFLPDSKPLLKVKSPKDGREHIVCWIHNFGKGRVFATTLGHDMKTAESTDYLRLVSNGLLWACDKLDGKAPKAAKAGK
jgi:type 1 glutamine amidotransferase